ncbi:NAD(P)/FAD-dependent oxidoreductase [Mucilaginibacter sp. BT774]|uniref:phytoene desaturase family protein n=1 Tax=Mucilaginibacter sp. BT774 TaxID=3062276 RepID=UPI0026771B2B|nr:phytoene desaturase family protein [Mucilaginibacter sp. BT774]MDO3627989.1 phytoene desaturase family protein [Mucilaginibacter sp. BT774]
MSNSKKVIVIGAGFSGLAASALMAKKGYDVTLLEKNDQPGGRARIWEKDGFRFDMGPSWYWMPDVFENYFALFDKKPAEFYELNRLDPGYRIYFDKDDLIDIPANMRELETVFENIEPASAKKLRSFLAQAETKYKTGMGEYAFKPSHSVVEYLNFDLVRKSINLQLLTNMHTHVRTFFKHPKLIQLLEFPALFLGATPQNTPALYSMMNYADLVLGTWYPMGGMHEIVKAMVSIAEKQGVQIELNTEVTKINIENGQVQSVGTSKGDYPADLVIAGADYEHVDQHLIDGPYRNYTKKYWNGRILSPSCLIWYIGVNKKLKNIQHHNLFFDEDFEQHAKDIYGDPKWPEKPLFYVCCSSKTDQTVAPENCENLFFLMPIAPGIKDNDAIRRQYLDLILSRFEKITGEKISENIIVKRSYALNDFQADYHSFKGNAYGLANTLKQTAFLKPAMRSKKIKNLLYTGQLTVPGPGVPPAIISGQVVAKEAIKYLASPKSSPKERTSN